MAQALPFVMMAGSAMSAMSAIQQGKAAKAAAEFNANIAEQNAQIEREQTISQVRQADREQYLRMGAIKAAQGASGGRAEGSVLDILADTAAQGELQRQDIVYQGALRERGHRNSAALDRFDGAMAKKQSYLKAGSELLSGAASAYSANSKLKRT
jgi:hypothetical protein